MSAARPRLIQDDSGATAIEFAILLVPLLVAILGLMELGYRSYVRSQLQGTLNAVARIASVETPRLGDSAAPLESRIEQRVRDRMALLVRSATFNFRIVNYQSFAGVGRPEALITDVNGNGRYDPGDCWQDSNPNRAFDLDAGSSGVGGADDVAVYQVDMAAPQLLPVASFVNASDTFTVEAKTMVRRQPFANQRRPQTVC